MRRFHPDHSDLAFFVWWHAKQIAYVAKILLKPGFVAKKSRFYWS